MAPLSDIKLTPALYEVFLSYKRATSKVERWLAMASKRQDTERLTISEMAKAANHIKSRGIKVPETIYYTLDEAIRARSEVTSHFRGYFASKSAEAKNASHEYFTNA